MVFVVEIKHIGKSDALPLHERIESVCGESGENSVWRLSTAEAIAGIEQGVWKFYVTIAGKPVWVEVAVDRSGIKYLKTEMDGKEPYWLLSLPDCGEGNARA